MFREEEESAQWQPYYQVDVRDPTDEYADEEQYDEVNNEADAADNPEDDQQYEEEKIQKEGGDEQDGTDNGALKKESMNLNSRSFVPKMK